MHTVVRSIGSGAVALVALTGMAVAGPLRVVDPEGYLVSISDSGRFVMIYEEDVDESHVLDRDSGERTALEQAKRAGPTLAGNGRVVFWPSWDDSGHNVHRWFLGAGRPHILIPDGAIPGFETTTITSNATGSVLGLWGYAFNPTRTPTYLYDVASGTAVRVTDDSSELALSDDGRFAAYEEKARTRKCPGCERVQVYDRRTGSRQPISVTPWGTISRTAAISNVVMSGDGQHVLFYSNGTDLVPGFTSDRWRLYLRDLAAGRTTVVSNGPFIYPEVTKEPPFPADISFDGRRVTYLKLAPTQGGWRPLEEQVFVKDAPFDSPDTRISFPGRGKTPNGGALVPRLTNDGRHVLFSSFASNLLPGVGPAATYVRTLSPLPAPGG